MKVMARAILLPAITVSLCSCMSYHGDGKFSDDGWMTGHDRYHLNLGSVNLSGSDHVGFKMSGLPWEEFTVGLTGIASCLEAAGKQPVRIRMALRLPDGRRVFSEDAPLQEWTRSGEYWYRRGKEKEVPLGDGVVQLERVGEGAHGGWGTYFSARPFSTYHLTLDVLDPKPPSGCEAGVEVVGGGWD